MPRSKLIYFYSSISKIYFPQPWFDEIGNRIAEIWKTRESSNESSLRGEQKPLYTDPISTFIGELEVVLQWFIGLIEKNEVYSLLGTNPFDPSIDHFRTTKRNWIIFSALFTYAILFKNNNKIFYYYSHNTWMFNWKMIHAI